MDPSNGPASAAGGDVALLVDWENLKFSLAQRERRPNVTALRVAAERFGRIVYARAYADWQDDVHAGDAASLYMAGLEPVYVLTKRYADAGGELHIKNSVDVKLTADCVEASHQFPNIGTYIIVSGDHSFFHVVNTLRPHGKRVVVVGVSWTTAAQLVEQADVVLYYDVDVDTPRPPEGTPAPARPAAEPPKKISPAMAQTAETAMAEIGSTDIEPRQVAEALDTVIAIVREFRKDRRELSVSLLGQELQKRMPPAEFARVVRGRARTLAQALASHGAIKLVPRDFVDWIYLPDEPDELISATTPPPPREPRYNYAGLVFADLRADQHDDVIRAIHDEKLRPGIDYLTFNRVQQAVGTVVQRDDYSLKNLVNNLLAVGILRFGTERSGRDAAGNTYRFATIQLDLQHPGVRRALHLA